MARLPRLHAPDAIQYLVQRATPGRTLFIDADDVVSFIRLLASACRQHGFALHAYALTPSEVHLLGTPAGPESSGDVLQAIGRAFVPGINRKADRTGALWERRYRSTIVDPELVLQVMRVVEAHAVEAGGGMGPPSSSRAHHIGIRQDAFLTDHACYWALSDTPFERQAIYRDWSASAPEPAFVARVRHAVEYGWALGSEAFLASLDETANRRVLPLKRGRPRKHSVDVEVSPIKGLVESLSQQKGSDP